MKTRIIRHNDSYYFQADDKIIDSLSFKSFRPTKKNVKEFYDVGVRLFHVYCSGLPSGLKVPYSLYGETWFGDHIYDFTNLDKQIDFFKETAPEAYVFINIHLDVRQWWLDQNPGNPNSFTHLSQIASNDKWVKDTQDYIRALIKHAEEKYNSFIMGYFLLGGYTTEWFSEFDYEQPNEYKTEAYRNYLNNSSIDIPSKEILERPVNEVILKDNLDKIIPYRQFHNELIVNTVLKYCSAAQEIINHNKVLGLFFGYLLELLDARMWNAGHIELDIMNHSNDVDVIATPSSYQFRNYDSCGAYMLLCDSLEINNKACFVSFDHTTFLVPDLPNNPNRLCNDEGTSSALKLLAQMRSGNKKDLLKDAHQTIQAMRREFMQRIAKRAGYWWFDMLEGWFYDEDLMSEVKLECKISHELINIKKKSISEVAVIFSSRSLYYMNKESHINTQCICNQREGLNKMGAPYDCYSLGDLNKINLNQYKLVIFVQCLLLDDTQRDIINGLKANGKSLLFIGPVDYANKGLDSVKEILGMNVSILDNEESSIVFGNNKFGYSEAKLDCFYIDEKIDVIGRYENSNKVGFARKNNVFFSGIGNLTFLALHQVLKAAGVHLYSEEGNAVFVTGDFIGIYSPINSTALLNFKNPGIYKELFTGETITVSDSPIKIDTSFNVAKMYLRIN